MTGLRCGLLAASLLLCVNAGCVHHDLKRDIPEPQMCCAPRPWAEGDKGQVDLLFVIDNSGSMADEQALLKAQFSALMGELRQLKGGLPDVHIGVISTDLGVGPYSITYCEDVGGDAGQLLTGHCTNPTGAPYLVDVAPVGCEITRTDDATGTCEHDCSPADCAREPSTFFVQDPVTGCPRCRNYSGEALEGVFQCIAGLGTLGCGFEQPLEAMYQALSNNPANSGFLRESAVLAVVFLTDEDDCSAATPELFSTDATDMDSPLGPLSSYRCFEFGVTCDINSRTHQGERQHCVPQEDPGALLYPISRYVSFLQALKDPDYLVVSAIAGPVVDGRVTVGIDEYNRPEVQPVTTCESPNALAIPGVRLRALVEAFNEAPDMGWAYTPICGYTYVPALEGVGRKVAEAIEANCPYSPFYGCPDVAVEFGEPGDGRACNDPCGAECQVVEIRARGLPSEVEVDVPPCLEVCDDGPCPGNTDRSLAYAAGHPDLRDPALPVGVCWHIRYQPICERSNFSEIVIARQTDPPPRTFSTKLCRMISQREELCHDGLDNDEDCLTDGADPDCAH